MDNTFLLNKVLKSDGTNQGQRLLAALDPVNIKIDDRGIKEILDFIYGLSKEINFFNINNDPDGDWRSFFNYFIDPVTEEVIFGEKDILKALDSKHDFDPHFSLFLAFLKLFQFAQKDINAIVQSRLDFYYKEVLRLNNKPAVPDKVHLILELAKNISSHKIDGGTQYKATKDGNSIPIYKTDTEIVINKAKIKSLKSVYLDKKGTFKIYAAKAANSKDGKGQPFPEPNAKWNAFGESQQNKSDQDRNMEEVKPGFAFASPMLLLKEGNRIVTLTINIKDNGHIFFTDNISNDVEVFFSGEKAWITPSSFAANISNTQLTIVAVLGSTDKSVVPYNKTVLKEPYNTQWPVLKVILKDGGHLYKDLYNLEIESARIDVAVNGVKDLVIQNNQSALNPSKPFQPFGAIPALDSAFYIGNAEVFQKKLSGISFDILWNEVPSGNLGEHYLGYFENNTSLANLIFTANISLLYRDNWLKLNNPDLPSGDYFLFKLEDAKEVNTIGINQGTINSTLSGHNYDRNIELQELGEFGTSSHDGFIRLELTGPDLTELIIVNGVLKPVTKLRAFGHNEFANAYAKTAMKMTVPGFTGLLPNAPYTPSIKSLSLNYSSSQDIYITAGQQTDQFFHVEPFGVAEINNERPYLFPQYKNETDTVSDELNAGNFYIGLEDLVPPQNLSLLFQVVEGSGDTSIIIEEENIQWSYLARNKWIPLTNLQVLRNTTRALQTPGIISFAIGSDANSDNTLMPEGMYWLRGTVAQDPAGISQFIDIKTQAIPATYIVPPDTENILADEHLDKALAPFSIKESVIKDAAVKLVLQPYNSFDGKAKERDAIFYTRVSERLRHKKRALTLWDYERFILEEFPSIFKVKCLTHTDEHSDLAPGAVSAVVVPSLINKNAANPLQPKVNLVTLQKIEEYVSGYIPLFVDFKVGNPVYEQLLVDCKVGFTEGRDAGYYGNLLNEEIKRFLSPWAYEEGQDITFGGKVNKSDILVFIESRDYVDFVNNFQLYHIFDGVDKDGLGIDEMAIEIDFIIEGPSHPGISEMIIGDDFIVGRPVEVAYAAGPRSILVSAPGHRITVLKAGEYVCEGTEYAGVGYWSIGVDFIIQ
jgi:hypothetical protein